MEPVGASVGRAASPPRAVCPRNALEVERWNQ